MKLPSLAQRRACQIADKYCHRNGTPRPPKPVEDDRFARERDMLERIVRNLRKNVPKSKAWLNAEIDKLTDILTRDHGCDYARMVVEPPKEEKPF
jgi:hypothetical protein